MSDENFSGSIGVGTHIRIGDSPNDIILESTGSALQISKVSGGVKSNVGFVPLNTDFSTGPLGIFYDSFTLNGILDPAWKGGYNPRAVSGKSQWYLGIEGNYFDGTDLLHEAYMHYVSADGTTVSTFRPWFMSLAKNANTDRDAIIVFNVGTSSRLVGGGGASFQVKSDAQTLLTLKDSGAFFPAASASWAMKMGTAFVQALPTDAQASAWGYDSTSTFATVLVANTYYTAAVKIGIPCSLTGIKVLTGSTASGNVRVAIYAVGGGAPLAQSNSTAMSGTFTPQNYPFTSPLSVSPGNYYLVMVCDNASAQFTTDQPMVSSGSGAQGGFIVPASLTPPGSGVYGTHIPKMATY